MSDEENPYRFSGDASEEIAPAPEIPRRLTLPDLKGLSRDRRLLGTLLALFGGSCLLALLAIALAPAPYVHAREAQSLYYATALSANAAALFAMTCLFIVGARMVAFLVRPLGTWEIFGLIVPGLNVVIALILIREAKVTLEGRGVRIGLIASDFSQARADRSYWRPRSL